MRNPQGPDWRELLGELGQPLPKLNKAEKLRLTAVMGSADMLGMPMEWRVRYCIATKSPLPLVNLDPSAVAKAVALRDFLRHIRVLFVSDRLLRGENVIRALIAQLNRSNARMGLMCLADLFRTQAKTSRATRGGLAYSIKLDPPTGVALMEAASRIALLVLSEGQQRASRKSNRKNQRNPFDLLLDLAFQTAKRCECAEVCSAGLELASTLKHHLKSSTIDGELERGEPRWTYLISMPSQLITDVLKNGCLADAEIISSRMGLIPQADRLFENAVRETLSSAGADLPLPSRQWAETFLGYKPPGNAATLRVDNESDVNLERMGALLLASWDAKDEGPKATHLFEVFSGICNTGFGLSLVGQVGEIVRFDPSRHQAVEGSILLGKPAKLLRPSVQWIRGEVLRIIVRALVIAT